MRRTILTVIVVALVVLAGCAGGGGGEDGANLNGGDGDASGAMGDGDASGAMGDGDGSGDGGRVGVSAGGAQDANAFRTNVREGYVPQPTDLTYEGLFHDYYFDTGEREPCEARFCPSYTSAVTRDPLSNQTERFVSVGLNSGLTQSDVGNQSLNLVVVVDTSGSMSSRFDEYYYDGGERKEVEENGRKMDAASEAVVSMLDRLDPEDRVSVVGYDSQARVVQDLRRVDETDMGDLRSDVRDLNADGGTNLDAGMRTAHDQVDEHADESDRETRVVYVTDAMPNLGETAGESLESRLRGYANEGIHSTFVGVGVDFNSRLTEAIATVKGANYYAVHSPAAFEERMDEGFDYMVSPLAHNLSLSVEGSGYEIDTVYGSPQAEAASGELMEVRTLFPSRREGNKSEGGVVLLELDKTGSDPALELVASYEAPDGTVRNVTRTVSLEDRDPPYYGSTGIRKAVTLSEYASLMRNWMAHERAGNDGEFESPAAGDSVEHHEFGSQWEQQSVPLTVTEPYDRRVREFVDYFERQQAALGAERMDRDLAVLQRLVNESGAATGSDDRPAETDPQSDDGGPTSETSDDDSPATDRPTATDSGGADRGEDQSITLAVPARLGGDLSTIALANLLVTVFVAAYSIRQKRRSREHDGANP